MSRGNNSRDEPRERERDGRRGDRGTRNDELTGDKSTRSVFVGNIPYEATEEKLREIFTEVGFVVSFKLVYDRENGKPRGYGFCEYQNPETALCAMRNLNGYAIGGRTLRVDSASTERNRMEMQAVMASSAGNPGSGPSGPGGQPVPDNSPYGDPVQPEKAPEAITRAVASLPPEQMFELMKQMKACIGNNPQEAKNMLLQNPQLAYALLQAQVVMRIVEPEAALRMLHSPMVGTREVEHPGSSSMGGGGMRGVEHPGSSSTGGGGMLGMRGLEHPGSSTGGGMPMMGDDGPMGRSYYGREMERDNRQRFGGGGGGRDPRNRDPRGGFDPPQGSRDGPPTNEGLAAAVGGMSMTATDPGRNQLIMQVLQLTDEQIAMLPIDQRSSIVELKKQFHRPK